jgi:hypothetical protein
MQRTRVASRTLPHVPRQAKFVICNWNRRPTFRPKPPIQQTNRPCMYNLREFLDSRQGTRLFSRHVHPGEVWQTTRSGTGQAVPRRTRSAAIANS